MNNTAQTKNSWDENWAQLILSKAACVPCMVSKNPKRAHGDKATFYSISPSSVIAPEVARADCREP